MDVSIIIPVHDGMPYLKDCLASVAAQTCRGIEVVCVDDGSTDGSRAAVRAFAADAPFPVEVVEQDCRGVSAARNAGLSQARGDYVLFVDADDLIDERTVEIALAKAREQDAEMTIFGFWEYYGAQGASMPRELCPDERLYAAPFALRDVEGLVTEVVTPNVWRILFRRAFVERNELRFHEELRTAEDLAFIHEALLCARRVALVGERLYRYRRDGGTTLTRAERGTTGLAALAAVRAFGEERGLFDEAAERQFANLVLDTVEYALWSAAAAGEYESIFKTYRRDWASWVAERKGAIADRYRPFFEAVSEQTALEYLFGLYAQRRSRLEGAEADRETLRRDLDATLRERDVARAERDAAIAERDELLGSHSFKVGSALLRGPAAIRRALSK